MFQGLFLGSLFIWHTISMKEAMASYPRSKPRPSYPAAMPHEPEQFLPAKPGETPSCVKDPRLTFCIEPEKYPEKRILYLLENKMYDVDTFLQDETRDTYTFEARDGPSYPATMMYAPRTTPSSYSKPHRGGSYSGGGGYGSRYKMTNDSSHMGYPFRTSNHKTGRRIKRQASGLADFCPSAANYIKPRAAQQVGGDWMFLVNLDEQYTQLVRSETCTQNECSGSCEAPDGFLAVCQQQYVQKRLVALDGSGSKLNQDTFWFPSCCLCKIRPGAG